MKQSLDKWNALMAYADGELSAPEAAEIEAWLASDPEAAQFVEQVGSIGSRLHGNHHERFGAAVASFDIADAVMDRIEGSSASLARISGQETVAAGDRTSTLRALAPSRPWRRPALSLGAVLAAAAAVMLVMNERSRQAAVVTAELSPVVATSSASEPASHGSGTGIDVKTIESPGSAVSVFYLPGPNELSTNVVVWVDETGEL